MKGKMPAGTRPPHVAATDWKAISLELGVFNEPTITVKETRMRQTTVADKWIFIVRG
jgi:hypothetical protein